MVASWLRARSDDCTTKVRDTPAVKLSDGPGIRMMIDDAWYDLTAWAPLHPGGAAILQRMDGQDATDAFYALHSDEALARLRQMKSTPCSSSESNSVPAVLRSFRTFRKQLQQRGFWVRSPFWETVFALHVCVLAALGAYLALQGWLLLSVLILSYAEVQAVWAGHDYGHARGRAFPFTYKFMYGVILGFSPTWWSNSHNAHHIYTNHDGVDLDIDSEPLFFFRFPPPKADTSFRCYQHWYWFPIITVTHFSWRMRSISQAWTSKNYEEFVLILLNYLWLSQIPLFVSLGSVLIAGFIVAVIVTGSHQAEDKFANDVLKCEPYNFVSTQFQTTRDVDTTSNWFFHCLWGGMQYQLEHHLFPTMPRYYYSQLAPEVKRFAAEHKLDYKRDGALEIILRNWKMIRYFAGDETERTMDKTDKNN